MTLTWYRHFQRNGGLNQILRRQISRFHYGSKVHFVLIISDSLEDTPLSGLYFHWETSLSFCIQRLEVVVHFDSITVFPNNTNNKCYFPKRGNHIYFVFRERIFALFLYLRIPQFIKTKIKHENEPKHTLYQCEMTRHSLIKASNENSLFLYSYILMRTI